MAQILFYLIGIPLALKLGWYIGYERPMRKLMQPYEDLRKINREFVESQPPQEYYDNTLLGILEQRNYRMEEKRND